ncbi:kinase-like domain-containing protein [Glomus cerebriforme]|uniref:Kinase-like domain-containing protein n=1 Tax=Glomus cerebriforme TaxID=658196 RepID=A0A397T6Z2_9GLOM|nr:kinase-like domain-containing protein [Glomus cerebriforme]
MNVNKDWYDNIAIENGILDIPYEQINKERTKIGFGKYGIVYKTTCSLIEGDVAIKEIYIRNQECIENFINEVRVHSLSRHRRIIQIYGISRNVKKNLYYIVMEYANNGTLRDFLSKNNPVDLKERIRLAIQISEGISYLHNKLYISHRDLHAKNILIKNGNIKISDFGNSKCFINDQKNFESHNVLDNSPFTFYKVSDIHSLGVILLELSNCRKTSHKELISKRCLKKDCLEIHEKSGMTSNLQLKPLEPVYLNTDKKSYIRAIQSPVF